MTLPISARFNLNYEAFRLDVDLCLPGTGISVLFGPSGSGKTTLLRCIAGLQSATQGFLEINGKVWQNSERGIFLPTHKRPLGYVFQEANLFPHLTVAGNLQFGLKRTGRSANTDLQHILELLGIDHLLKRMPDRLSGGERQRVAIARALALNPEILLMDEPLAALDFKRKQEILPFLSRLHRELNIPVLYVTHSQQEVAQLADHLVVMADGKVLASGALNETLARLDLPVCVGEEAGVVLKAHIAERDPRWNLTRAEFTGGSLWMRDMGFVLGSAVRLRVLARDVSLSLESDNQSSILNVLPAVVRELGDGEHPAVKHVRLQVGESSLLCRLTTRSVHALGLEAGKPVWAQIKSAAIVE